MKFNKLSGIVLKASMACAGFVSMGSLMRPLKVFALEDMGNTYGDVGGTVSADDKAVVDWISNQRGMTSEQLHTAGQALSPLTNACGYVAGGVVALTFAGVFVITALDLLYITLPPIRGLLYSGGSQSQMGGGNGQSTTTKQWISDEALACVSAVSGGSQSQMGGGYGGYGGYGGMQQQSQPQKTKSVLGMYFKKRIVFMVLLGLCAVVLTSSALLGTGANLAQFVVKLVSVLNGSIPT